MKYGKLIALAGLGASASTASASPLITLSNNTPDLGRIPFTSTLFPGLKNDSPDLYQTFNLKCTLDSFKELETPDPIKNQVIESKDPSNFQLPNNGSSISSATGCLKIDLKLFKDPKTGKGNLLATIEMAVSRGTYGIILLNSISNMLNRGDSGFDYRAIFLQKVGRKWQIKAGIQWQDKLFMDNSKPEKMKWTLPDNKVIDEIFWKNSMCRLSKDCETQLQKLNVSNKVEEHLPYEWSSLSGTQNIYQGLKIENLGPSSGSKTTDFWNGQETPMAGSNVAQKPSAIFVNGQWKKTTTGLGVDAAKFQNWFNIFKSEKGHWKKK